MATIRGDRNLSVEGLSPLSTRSLLRSCRAIAPRPTPLAASPVFGSTMVSSQCKPTSTTQIGNGNTVRYPLQRLRRKKMAVAKPMILMIASVRGKARGLGRGW